MNKPFTENVLKKIKEIEDYIAANELPETIVKALESHKRILQHIVDKNKSGEM